MGKYGTDFAETEALLAVSQDDAEHLKQLLRGMMPGELSRLVSAANELKWAASDELSRQRELERREGRS